ncbi:hypothetical protein Tel_01160 [Candidatus Tenderia electrophaga]|uniref:DUF5050 domain-containing protein n=1 Tax=Candidatus Tenderia electrophaga TaxID=1748243 RepID=A0A0S2T9S1_9GAMM|nr:hypothetical protein Tel_01160 [Candidatus Tenderia electrophaga]
MIGGAKIGRFGGIVLAVSAVMLTGCEDDSNSFRALPFGATAIGPDDTAPLPDPVKVMVVGDGASPELANVLGGRNFDVTNVPFDNSLAAADIDMAGDYIVWTDNRNGNPDIYGYQISTGAEFAVSTAAGAQRSPKIAGDYVVWEDSRNGNVDIYGYRLLTGTGFAITTALQNQRFPQIDGDYVVWQDSRNGEADIYAYRISTGEELAISTAADKQWNPHIDGDYIVWQSYQGGLSDIHYYRISSAQTTMLSAAGSQYNPQVSGHYLVWVDNRNGSDDIYAYDLSSAQEIVVSSAANQQLRPQVAGDYVVWQDYRNGSDYDIYAYHLPSASEIAVAVAAGDQTSARIHGDLIVWQDGRMGDNDVRAYRLSTAQQIQMTDHATAQTQPALSADHIAWLDARRGVVDVMFREGTAGDNQIATSAWLTPAGVTDFGANKAVLLGSDIFSAEIMLQLFDAAVAANVGVLGLGGTGNALATALANAGRYGLGVTPDSGCFPTQIIALDPDHAVFTDLNTAAVIDLETSNAVTMDELAISFDVNDPTNPRQLASFSGNMCNASQPALVEFNAANGTPVLLDGSASVADNYEYWSDARRTLLVNAMNYLAGD